MKKVMTSLILLGSLVLPSLLWAQGGTLFVKGNNVGVDIHDPVASGESAVPKSSTRMAPRSPSSSLAE